MEFIKTVWFSSSLNPFAKMLAVLLSLEKPIVKTSCSVYLGVCNLKSHVPFYGPVLPNMAQQMAHENGREFKRT